MTQNRESCLSQKRASLGLGTPSPGRLPLSLGLPPMSCHQLAMRTCEERGREEEQQHSEDQVVVMVVVVVEEEEEEEGLSGGVIFLRG